ncbi:hypothetical protein TI03_02020 [Achromatium sp. WMS1]|nr:hypothetical protein TI03_02020 [Achromatium sp. WMS1]
MKAPEGFNLWKSKNVQLTHENLLENIFVLSSDIADFFGVRHFNLLRRNISKLQKEKHLPDHALKIVFMIGVGKSAQREQEIYALTRHQAEILIMDFSGPKARDKKIAILKRLQAIEVDVLQGSYSQAREKAQTWDGVQLLKDLGFSASVNNEIATKKDIATFLKVPETTLGSFLHKHKNEIQCIRLDLPTIRSIGSKANHMNGYPLEEVAKIVLGMNTEVGIDFKNKFFGEVGAAFVKPQTTDEVQWRKILSKIFDGFDLYFNYLIGKYRVDFFIAELNLVLECNGFAHKYYNPEEETKREQAITQKYALVRFAPEIDVETLINGILQAKIGTIIRLYDAENVNSDQPRSKTAYN